MSGDNHNQGARSLSSWDLVAYRMRSGRMSPPDAPETAETRRLNCPVCGSGGFGDCTCPARGEVSSCPKCQQGKHGNCDGTTWDNGLDEPTACPCVTCYGSAHAHAKRDGARLAEEKPW